MSKATSTDSAFTRRAAMMGLATAAPVVALAGFPEAATAAQSSYPELQGEFDAFYQRWFAQQAKDATEVRELEARITAATGFTRDSAPDRGEPGYEEYSAGLDRVIKEVCGDADDISIWEALTEEQGEITERIMARPIRNMGDVLLQTRAAALNSYHDWFGSGGRKLDDNTWGTAALRKLAQNICWSAGVEAVPTV